MEIIVSKNKLGKGQSHALRSSVLQRALDEAEIDIYVYLNLRLGCPFFYARYLLPRFRADYERIHIYVGSVNSSQAKSVREYVEKDVIPAFIEWAKEMIDLPAESTKLSLERPGGSEFMRDFP